MTDCGPFEQGLAGAAAVDGLHIDSHMNANVKTIIGLVLARFPQIKQIWTYATFPDHVNRRCVDYMITIPGMPRDEQIKLGDEIAAWHKTYAKQLGVNGVIWNRRVMGFPHTVNPAYRGPYGQWRDYTGPKSHTDHNHVEYDGTPPTLHDGPKPYEEGWVPPKPWTFYLDKQKIGVTQSTSVWLLQHALKLKPYDGNYVPTLRDAVQTWQKDVAKDDPKLCDGILGPRDAALLFGPDVTVQASSA